MKTGFGVGEHTTVAHARDALALVSFGNVGANKRKGNSIELSSQHGIYVIHELARDRILICGHAQTEIPHRPLNRRPVQSGKTSTDTKRALTQFLRGTRKNRGL